MKEAVEVFRRENTGKQSSLFAILSSVVCISFSQIPEGRLIWQRKNGEKFYVAPLKVLRKTEVCLSFLNWEFFFKKKKKSQTPSLLTA